MDTESGIFTLAIKKIRISFVEKWVEMETIILRKTAETKKGKYHKFSLTHGAEKFEKWLESSTEIKGVGRKVRKRRIRKGNREDIHDQNKTYACIEMSHWNLLIGIIHIH